MIIEFKHLAECIGYVLDGLGILIILAGVAYAVVRFFKTRSSDSDPYRSFRQTLGRGILLGLELLVAGDIIKTVAVDPTLENMGVLAIIVIIRTCLSFSLELEINGRWPWQQKNSRS